ncbi:MAG: glycosyltransferase [bacterium]
MIIYFFFFLLSIYLLINLFIIYFTQKNEKPAETKNYKSLTFSIIISLKNEEYNIKNLIDSLKDINYNINNYEIIFIDDNSSDNTFELIHNFSACLSNFKILTSKNKIYPAKKGALDIGIKEAKNDYILITDADCIIPTDWINEYNKKFNNNFHLVFGASPFIQKSSFINKFSCFENLRTLILTFFASKINFPYSAAARNIGFKKSFYFKIDGFSNMLDTYSGDDDLLIREAIKNNAKIGVLTNNNSFVYSSTKNTVSNFLKQKFRHTSTSYHYSLKQLIFPFVWHVINIFLLFSVFLFQMDKLFLIPFLIKLVIDIFVNKFFQKQYNYSFSLVELFFFQMFYEIFIILKFPISYFYKKKW